MVLFLENPAIVTSLLCHPRPSLNPASAAESSVLLHFQVTSHLTTHLVSLSVNPFLSSQSPLSSSAPRHCGKPPVHHPPRVEMAAMRVAVVVKPEILKLAWSLLPWWSLSESFYCCGEHHDQMQAGEGKSLFGLRVLSTVDYQGQPGQELRAEAWRQERKWRSFEGIEGQLLGGSSGCLDCCSPT